MAYQNATAFTKVYWAFEPYTLAYRGHNIMPERFLGNAQWEGHHHAGLGYYTRAQGTEDESPIPVEFNPEHLSWVEKRRNQSEGNWSAFRIAASDLQLSVPLSRLTNEELQRLIRSDDPSEGELQEQLGAFHLLRNEAPPSTPPSAPPTQPSMEDTPKRIVVYHDQDGEMEAMAQRAESLHLNDGHANATQTQELPTRTINPTTGHMEGADPADNLAVFRAFGPDRPDPPPGRGGGGGGGGGGGDGGGGGGNGR